MKKASERPTVICHIFASAGDRIAGEFSGDPAARELLPVYSRLREQFGAGTPQPPPVLRAVAAAALRFCFK